ncbi:MAG: hypothetical protein RIR26_772 [Pseudomonadota bacterium]
MLEDAKSYRIFESWHRLRRSTRLALIVAATSLIGTLVMTSVAIDQIQKIRIEGLSRSTLEHAQSVAMSGRANFSDHAGPREFITISRETIDSFKTYKLPRWPAKGEYFVGEKGGRLVVFGRSTAGQVWYAPMSYFPSPWRSSEHTSYWFTAQGLFLGANTESVSADTFSKRLLVQFYESSQGLFGGDFFRPASGPIFGAFFEMPKSNVVVAIETKAQRDWVLLRSIFLTCVVLVVSLSLVARWIGHQNAQSYLKPTKNFVYVLQLLMKGVFEKQDRSRVDHEFSELYATIQKLGVESVARDKKFEGMKEGFERLLVGSREMTLVQDRYTVVAIGASVLQGAISLTKECNIWLYLLDKAHSDRRNDDTSSAPEFLSAQLVSRGISQSALLVFGDCPHAKDPNETLKSVVPFLEPQTRLLYVPVLFEERSVGFFVVEGFLHEKIPPFEKVFLDAVSGNVGIALRNVNVIEETRHSARMEGEILATETVQRSLISRDFQMDRTALTAFFSPAERAGGDWFHFHYSQDDDHLYIFVGDVTGHGIPSAMMTAVAFGAVCSAEKLVLNGDFAGGDVELKLRLMAEMVNSTILEAGQERFFMTMLFLALHVPTGLLSVLNAGHPAPLVVDRMKRSSHVLPAGGSPLGSQSEGHYEFVQHHLKSGDGVFAYTDGLIENEGHGGRRLSKRHLSRVLAATEDPEATLSAVVGEGRSIWEENLQVDDMTAVWLYLRDVS